MYETRPTLTVLMDSRISRENNKWPNPNLMLKCKNHRLGRAFPILWSLNTGEDVDNAHTPIPAHLSRRQFGNRQKVSKANSAKGSLAKGRIKPKMFTNSGIQHHSRYSRKCIITGKKEEPTKNWKEPKSSLFVNTFSSGKPNRIGWNWYH